MPSMTVPSPPPNACEWKVPLPCATASPLPTHTSTPEVKSSATTTGSGHTTTALQVSSAMQSRSLTRLQVKAARRKPSSGYPPGPSAKVRAFSGAMMQGNFPLLQTKVTENGCSGGGQPQWWAARRNLLPLLSIPDASAVSSRSKQVRNTTSP